MNRTTRIKITELNPHVICVLCGGYFINATTITECLHSFCRTCITRYLQTSKYCPVCDVMVHKTKPLDYIRSDKTLQDLVYKLVPGLYKNEMKRRREYYAEVDPPGLVRPPSEDRGDEFHDRIIYTEDEKISLSLELCARGVPFKTPANVHGHTGPDNIRTKDVRYLQCPAAFSVGNLKKFIRMKFDLKRKYEMDIFHTAEPLPDYYSLMDIAYIYTWTRRTPLRLFYTVFERPGGYQVSSKPVSISQDNAISSPSKVKETVHRSNKPNEPKVKASTAFDFQSKNGLPTQKRKYPEGPDDISPDFTLDSERPVKKKRGPKPKKKAKKILDLEEEESVKEAMSESEEQLAKLTLDCSDDGKRVDQLNGGLNTPSGNSANSSESSSAIAMLSRDICHDSNAVSTNVDGVDIENELNQRTGQDCNNDDSGVESESGCSRNIASESVFDQETTCNDLTKNPESVDNDTISLTVDTCSDNSKAPSNQTSPDSVHLTLFQPLNVAVDNSEHSNNKRKHSENEDNEETHVTKIVKKGRPKGSKNKKKMDIGEEGAQTNGAKTTGESVIAKKGKKKHVEKPEKDINDTTKMCSSKCNGDKDNTEGVIEKVKRKYVRKQKPRANLENEANSKTLDKMSIEGGAIENQINETDMKETNRCTQENTTTLSKELPTVSLDSFKTTDEKTVCDAENDITSQITDETPTSGETELRENENTIIGETNVLVEPVTPLYGETPKVSESNQALPCSPKIKPVVETENDVEENKTVQNHIPKSIETKVDPVFPNNQCNGNNGFLGNGPTTNLVQSVSGPVFLAYPSAQNTMVGYCRSPFYQNAVRLDNPTSMFTFGNVATVACPVSSPPSYFGGFPQPQINVHAHANHLPNLSNGNAPQQSCDPHSDQPLDLTNGFNREEYTKGKIFKTKMLKKSCPKNETNHMQSDKPQNGLTSMPK